MMIIILSVCNISTPWIIEWQSGRPKISLNILLSDQTRHGLVKQNSTMSSDLMMMEKHMKWKKTKSLVGTTTLLMRRGQIQLVQPITMFSLLHI